MAIHISPEYGNRQQRGMFMLNGASPEKQQQKQQKQQQNLLWSIWYTWETIDLHIKEGWLPFKTNGLHYKPGCLLRTKTKTKTEQKTNPHEFLRWHLEKSRYHGGNNKCG